MLTVESDAVYSHYVECKSDWTEITAITTIYIIIHRKRTLHLYSTLWGIQRQSKQIQETHLIFLANIKFIKKKQSTNSSLDLQLQNKSTIYNNVAIKYTYDFVSKRLYLYSNIEKKNDFALSLKTSDLVC
jgi:hypothetical protein